MRRSRLVIVLAVVSFAALFLVLSYSNSLVLTAVSIHIKDGVREHMDHTLLGIGAQHQLPDYKVKLHVTRRFLNIDLGTKLDTSATNWLEFRVHDIVPFRHLQEVLVIEDDKVESDLLERIQVTGEEIEGTSFRYRLSTTRSFDAGMNWFFDTPLGKAVFAGIVVGVILLVYGLFRSLTGKAPVPGM